MLLSSGGLHKPCEGELNKGEPRRGEKRVSIWRVTRDGRQQRDDILAVEEPLEIRVVFGPREKRRSKSLSITMRTPGRDFELAAGFLLSENIVSRPEDIISFEHVGPVPEHGFHGNTLSVELGFEVPLEMEKLQRHFYTTSSCGICGKASLDAVRSQGVERLEDPLMVETDVIFRLPEGLREQQDVFDRTGGLHAAGLADPQGEFIAICEDVGRHNAVDKLIGSQLIEADAEFPLAGKILVVSGRASFELMQKALMAKIPMLVAVGAPSSLAVELAEEFNMTLIGFASNQRFNTYAGVSRIE